MPHPKPLFLEAAAKEMANKLGLLLDVLLNVLLNDPANKPGILMSMDKAIRALKGQEV